MPIAALNLREKGTSMRLFVLTLFVALIPLAADAQNRAKPQDDGVLQIDGKKNPELIPQWSVWEFAFSAFKGRSRDRFPRPVYDAVTEDEANLIRREAEEAQKIAPACEERMSKLRSLLKTERLDVLDLKAHELNVDCRRQTLRIRDRVLASISPEARAALTAFVESTKAGMNLTIQKRGLARFLEPE